MLRVNQLNGFNRRASSGGSGATQPVNPNHVYNFETATLLDDGIGSSDLTASGTRQTVPSGKDSACVGFSNGEYLLGTSLLSSVDFTVTGWVRCLGSNTADPLTVAPVKASFSTSADSVFASEIWFIEEAGGFVPYLLHGSTFERIGTSTFADGDWIFFALQCDTGTSLKVRINNDTATHSLVPAFTNSGNLLISSSSTIPSTERGDVDAMYVWTTSVLTDAQTAWLYNGGLGRFWDEGAGDWA
jgi:hypothetical protein